MESIDLIELESILWYNELEDEETWDFSFKKGKKR